MMDVIFQKDCDRFSRGNMIIMDTMRDMKQDEERMCTTWRMRCFLRCERF